MSCTRVLHAIGSHPQPAVMPVDLAMCLSLSQRQPLYELLSMSPLGPAQRRCQSSNTLRRTSFRSPRYSSSSLYGPSSSGPISTVMPSEPRSCFRRDIGGGLNKKRVVFADAKGLALTAVRLFIPEPPSPVPTLLMNPSSAKLQGQQSTLNKLQRCKLRMGFPQPTLDIKGFLTRLREMCVQLESCNISEHSLSGKVRVLHASPEKSVNVRVTFDSWRTHHDIPCTFQHQQRSGGLEMDLFTFDLSLPNNIDPTERIEFCVSLRPGPGATLHWDNNKGQAYRLCMEKGGSESYQGDANHFYPTLSKARPPSYVSINNMLNTADPQGLQRTLSNRIKAEMKTMCPSRQLSEIGPHIYQQNYENMKIM